MLPLSSDVITPALVQEATSKSGVSFPPPTHPITASPAYPVSHSGPLSLLSESVCPDTDVSLLSHPLIKAVDLNSFSQHTDVAARGLEGTNTDLI